jgi:hypothetical protein
MGKKLKTILKTGALVLLGCFLLAEIGLRIAGFTYTRWYIPDDYTGSRHNPGVEDWYRDEGNAFVKINSQGMRDRERAVVKPPDVVRIAVLGDSYGEAFQVPMEETFWSVLEEEANRCKPFGGKKVEVLNFSCGGYGTDQEFLALQHRAWQYSPDIVLVAFNTAKDVIDNSKILYPDPEKLKPFFVFRGDSLVLDNSFLGNPSFRHSFWTAFRPVLTFSKVVQWIKRYRDRREEEGIIRNVRNLPEGSSLSDSCYLPPVGPGWTSGWKVTEGILAKMHGEVKARGARLIVMCCTNSIQVNPDSAERKLFMRRMGVDSLTYPNARIQACGEGEGFEVLNVLPDFLRYAQEHHAYLHGFENTTPGVGHWNTAGHRLAGELLARYLCTHSQQTTMR